MAFIEPTQGALARIKVVGVGGGGQNAVNSMVADFKSPSVEFIAMNTDLQALDSSVAQVRVQLGPQRAHGLGSGADPEIGLESAQESTEEIKSHLQGADMIFIAAGMGGGTGTGAAPLVAKLSKELGALTVGVVTKPFEFEGKRRMSQAEDGIRELKDCVDALIVIPNEKLLSVVDPEMPLIDAFRVADEVVGKAVEGISDLISSNGLVNVDFADVRTIMQNAGSALMGIGEADGENRGEKAAKSAVNSPLLDVDIKGSTGILINIVGDSSLTMHEVNKASKIVSEAAHEAANIIFGANIDPEIKGIRVTVIATGFDSGYTTMGVPELSSISSEELYAQIDSRLDKKDEDNSNEAEVDIVYEEDYEEAEVIDFDIEKLRKEVKKMEKAEKTKKEEDKVSDKDKEKDDKKTLNYENNDDDGKSFWNFIKKSRE